MDNFPKCQPFPKSSLTSWKYEIGPFDPKHECFLLFKEDGIASLCTWYKILYFHVHCLLICWLMNIQIYVHCLLMCWFRDNFKILSEFQHTLLEMWNWVFFLKQISQLDHCLYSGTHLIFMCIVCSFLDYKNVILSS